MVQEVDGKQIALWAYKLSFNHPVTKETMEFKVLPEINRNMENNRRFRNLKERGGLFKDPSKILFLFRIDFTRYFIRNIISKSNQCCNNYWRERFNSNSTKR